MADAYLNCNTTDLSVEALLRAVSVDSDGDAYFDCDNTELSIEDLFRSLIVEDASGNPALSIYSGTTAAGTIQHHEFTTTAGQTVFNTTAFFNIDANYKVFVDGAFQSWGHTRVGNVVTFALAFNAGHEVSIWQ